MGSVTEIRVHGVSGTPPRNMLRTDPVIVGRRPLATDDELITGNLDKKQPVEVSRGVQAPAATGPTDSILAYNWSKLTSGRPRHAFWLLLLPYTFINVAGWMLPPRQRGEERGANEMGMTAARWMDVTIRLSGGIVTAIFTMFTTAVLVDLVAKCRPGTDRCSGFSSLPTATAGQWLIAATAAALLPIIPLVLIGVERGRRAQATRARAEFRRLGGEISAPEPGEGDPVATLTVTDTTLWHPRQIYHHLVRIHVAFAALASAWVLTTIRWSTTGIPGSFWVVLIATLAVPFSLVLISSRRRSGTIPRLSRGAALAGVAAFVVAAVDAAGLSDEGWDTIAVEAGLSYTAVGLTLSITLVGSVIWMVGKLTKYSTSGSAALVVLGGLVGGAFGAGVYTLVHRALISGRDSDDVPPLGGMDWAALGFLVYILIMLGAVLLTMVFESLSLDQKLSSEGVRLVTTKVRGHLGWPAAAALAGAGFFVVWSIVNEGAEVPSPFSVLETQTGVLLVGLSIVVLGLLVLLLWRYFRWKIAIVGAVGIVVLYLAVSLGWITELKLLGASVRFDSLRELTVALALLVPIGFIGSRLISTFRSREQRRGMAILWDLASFWPRWYHPFAAPPYTPVAVPDLAALILEKAGDDGRVVVTAHSQGSIISMVALLAIDHDDPAWDRLAYLTYGNPLCHLYGRVFPAHFNADAISALSTRLGGRAGGCDEPVEAAGLPTPRWRNLWRQSDPIGGNIGVYGVSSDAITEEVEKGHSAYEATEAFDNARQELMQLIGR